MTRRIVCFVCHRWRPLDKLTDRRCTDRNACYEAMARVQPGRPVLTKSQRQGY